MNLGMPWDFGMNSRAGIETIMCGFIWRMWKQSRKIKSTILTKSRRTPTTTMGNPMNSTLSCTTIHVCWLLAHKIINIYKCACPFSDAFSKNGEMTLAPKAGAQYINTPGQSYGPSHYDYIVMNMYYCGLTRNGTSSRNSSQLSSFINS
jgi:hypothetical protein